jgi:hypothetical protein
MSAKTSDPASASAVFFLAGPIRGGSNWRQKAVNEMYALWLQAEYNPRRRIVIVSPDEHVKLGADMKSEHQDRFVLLTPPEFGRRQLDFEREYLASAAETGGIIFWLPKESVTSPRSDGQYARDTRYELGVWAGRAAASSPGAVRMYIGMEAQFPGADILERNLLADLGSRNLTIYRFLPPLLKRAFEGTGLKFVVV